MKRRRRRRRRRRLSLVAISFLFSFSIRDKSRILLDFNKIPFLAWNIYCEMGVR